MKNVFTICLLLIISELSGQNLIQNGSFENYTGACNNSAPNGDFQKNVLNWNSSGPDKRHGYSSVDLFCGQANYSYCLPGPNLVGSHGSVYAGFHTRIFTPPYNEAIYQVLNKPLEQGKTYIISLDLITCQSGLFTGASDLNIYTNVNSKFPLCPADTNSVQLLGTISYNTISKTKWKNHAFSFVAPKNCNVIIFSGTCAIKETYYYIDNIILKDSCSKTFDIGNDTTLCEGDTLTLNVTTPNSTYRWQDSSHNPKIKVSKNGTYWVQISNSCGTISDTIQVNFIPKPINNLGKDTNLCVGNSLVLNAKTLNATYLWQDNTKNSNITVNQAGTYWLKITHSNCTSFDTINIDITPLPQVDLGINRTLCEHDSIVLDATSNLNLSYLWQDGSTNPKFNVKKNGIFWVKVENYCGFKYDSISIDFLSKPKVHLGKDTVICNQDTFDLNAFYPNAKYSWHDGSTYSKFKVNKTGLYWVKVENTCGFEYDTIQITYLTKPIIELGNDSNICIGDTIFLDAFYPNSKYSWQDGSNNSKFYVRKPGIYIVKVENKCGIFYDTKLIDSTNNCECKLYICNAFSPNSDEINEKFAPVSNCKIHAYSLIIYNHWGEKIFQTNDPNNSWDGTYLGERCQDDVYLYIVQCNLGRDKRMYRKYGNVMLLK